MLFFQNFNFFFFSRKTLTVLLEALSICNNDILQYFWQYVYSIPKELRVLDNQEWLKRIFDTLFWCEPYSSDGILRRPEQMVVKRGKVCAIQRLRQNIPGALFQLVFFSRIILPVPHLQTFLSAQDVLRLPSHF